MPRRPADDVPPSQDELAAAFGGNIASSTAVSEVTRRLLDYFTGDAMQPGDRLPPERQIAASMGVGRSAVREALAALELLGVVDVRPGSGTYLRGKASELLPQTLSWGILMGAEKTRELIDVRHGLEVQAARLAAQSTDADVVTKLELELAAMEANMSDFPAFVAADMRFHQALAAAANNSVLEDLLQSVRSLLRVWVDRALNDTDHATITCGEHGAILDAVRAQDPDAAASAMSIHMDSAGRRLLDSLGSSTAA
jgi:GntR family transcriptional regulator, transcriptional repressor for pyruvate dehydrogenase complex